MEDDDKLKQCRIDCAENFVGLAEVYLAILFTIIWVVQIVSANRAWNFMHDQADKKAIKNGTQLLQFHTAPHRDNTARIRIHDKL